MEYVQKNIELSDEERKIHVSKGSRREWTIYDEWSYDIKVNAICTVSYTHLTLPTKA